MSEKNYSLVHLPPKYEQTLYQALLDIQAWKLKNDG